ncbi:mitochondrial import inner membrane translocase subunit TIM16 [Tilletia horrida]|nr:mitochondrial import inner membrane translocase subunit TIM16 [Tilletia horrida]
MSNLPRIIGQIIFNGSIILGRAFAEAGKQAIRNARSGEAAAAAASAGSAQGGVGGRNGTAGGDPSHALTRVHRMTLQEALQILNLKAPTSTTSTHLFPRTDVTAADLAKRYEHLFKTNAPPAPKGSPPGTGGQGSFYIQSKVVRARERIEAEWEALDPALKEEASSSTNQGGPGASDSAQSSNSQQQPPPQ